MLDYSVPMTNTTNTKKLTAAQIRILAAAFARQTHGGRGVWKAGEIQAARALERRGLVTTRRRIVCFNLSGTYVHITDAGRAALEEVSK